MTTGIVFNEEFKQWLSSAPSDGVPIDTVEVYHPKWGSIWLAKWKNNITARLETGAYQEFTAADFSIDQLPITKGTGQTIQAALNGLEGRIYQQLKSLTPEDRQTSIKVTYRLYLNTLLEFPLVDPPPVLEVSTASAQRELVTLELAPSALPNILVGKYYFINDFPGLSET